MTLKVAKNIDLEVDEGQGQTDRLSAVDQKRKILSKKSASSVSLGVSKKLINSDESSKTKGRLSVDFSAAKQKAKSPEQQRELGRTIKQEKSSSSVISSARSNTSLLKKLPEYSRIDVPDLSALEKAEVLEMMSKRGHSSFSKTSRGSLTSVLSGCSKKMNRLRGRVSYG